MFNDGFMEDAEDGEDEENPRWRTSIAKQRARYLIKK
jgi:hypothetical protein